MSPDTIGFQKSSKQYSKGAKLSSSLMDLELNFGGYNEDIIESYYWHINFAYFTGKGYKAIKLEDHHYFSENSQFGANYRQVKGGSIRAFQENLSQMVQLVKTHLMPLLKEVKAAEFYKLWLDKITDNDQKIREHISKGGKYEDDSIKKYRNERDEAISHIKDKWVNEVDGGRLWQMNRPATDQGLDFALLPQLFFGINLPDPFQTKQTIKEQLDEFIYPVDVSLGAKEAVARFMYRFYTWLPTAINETNVTFKIKVSALKQFYAQLLMYADFMKPLLVEIQNKKESLDSENFFRDFASENPEFVNLFDYSYSYVKLAGAKIAYEGITMQDLEFTQYGFFIPNQFNGKDVIIQGKFKGKSGFIVGEKDGKYMFLESSQKDISRDEFERLKLKWNESPVFLDKLALRTYPVMMMTFTQKRKNHILQTQQGAQNVPYMANQIKYKAYPWNVFELAAYRQEIKNESLEILSYFIEEIAVVRDELAKYVEIVNKSENKNTVELNTGDNNEKVSNSPSKSDYTLITGPFQGLGVLFSPFIPNISGSLKKKQKHKDEHLAATDAHLLVKLQVVEDTWKMYQVHKKTKGFIQF